MKKILAIVLATMLLLCSAAFAEEAAPILLGQVDYAAHGTQCFAVLTVAVQGDTIVAAYIDEFQYMADTAEGVPNSGDKFGENYPEGKVLASKRVNNGMYSTNMTNHAGSTTPLGVNYDKIQEYVTGKTIAELEAELAAKSKEEMVDAVSGCTLVDTYGYIAGLVEAAKAAGTQTGYYTLYNKTGEKVTMVVITENATGESAVVAQDMDVDAVAVATYSIPASREGHGALTFTFVTESGYQGTFATLSIETAPITMLAADALTGPTQISFFAPAAE